MMFYKSTTISMYLVSKLVEVRYYPCNRVLHFIYYFSAEKENELHRLCQTIPV